MLNAHDLIKAQTYINKLQIKRAKENAVDGVVVTDAERAFDLSLADLGLAIMQLNIDRARNNVG